MKLSILLLLLLLLRAVTAEAQADFRIVWYNAENLFDTTDNPLTDDNEYLPHGERHWTNARYYHKLQQTARVVSAAGEWATPALVGLCEVENDSVLTHLVGRTPLRQQQYRYCITQSRDRRGINVALLYQRDRLRHIGHSSYAIDHSRQQHKQSRDILHVWGEIITGDTLDVFVCHFPSRYGGEKESQAGRVDAARTLREVCDSLFLVRSMPRIVIMGDFNDTPHDDSMLRILAANIYDEALPAQSISPTALYNLFGNKRQPGEPTGSHKYQGEWSQLDQIIVSGNLLLPQLPMHLKPRSNRIFSPSFLLTNDKTWRGKRPLRTFYGFKYEGGYSDHLPLIIDLLSPNP